MSDPVQAVSWSVAIVGAGPAGFFCAGALLKGEMPPAVDLYEKLPVPYGLVRYGVAPDHPEIKAVSRQFDRIASHPGFSFFGNVEAGRDVAVRELLEAYDGVILACGAPVHRALAIPGESLRGSYDAAQFVGWYNGHPDHAGLEMDIRSEAAVVIGNGNVAIDVARLLAKSTTELGKTDIAGYALDALGAHGLGTVHIVGRRGPVQSSFSTVELRELDTLERFAPVANRAAFDLGPASRVELESVCNAQQQRAFRILEEFSRDRDRTGRAGTVAFHFLLSPVEILGEEEVTGVRLCRNRLDGEPGSLRAVPGGEEITIPCGLVVRCIGYRAVPLEGAPFDERRGVVPNEAGRVGIGQERIRGLYVAGWLKHGPRGLIGANKKESAVVAGALLEDLPTLPRAPATGPESLRSRLASRGTRITTFAEWQRIDAAEVMRGQAAGKPREKFTSTAEMLECLGGAA